MTFATSRRTMLGGMAGLAALGAGRAQAAATPPLPASPVSLNVIDVAGQLQLTQRAMDDFARANPKLVSRMTYSQAPAPELPGKLKAQQDAGRVDIDLVLTGTDALACMKLCSEPSASSTVTSRSAPEATWLKSRISNGPGETLV